MNGDWADVRFAAPFDSSPVFVAATQTRTNNPASHNLRQWAPFVKPAVTDVSTSGARVILDKSEAGGTVTQPEQIGWIAVEAGSHCDDDGYCFAARSFQANQGANVWTGWSDYWCVEDPGCTPTTDVTVPSYPFSDDPAFSLGTSTPIVVGCLNTRNGNNGGWMRLVDATDKNVQVVVDEDTVQDAERDHIEERLSIMAFSGPGHWHF